MVPSNEWPNLPVHENERRFGQPIIRMEYHFSYPAPMHLDSGIRTFRPELFLFRDGGNVIKRVLCVRYVIRLAFQLLYGHVRKHVQHLCDNSCVIGVIQITEEIAQT